MALFVPDLHKLRGEKYETKIKFEYLRQKFFFILTI